MEDLDETLRDRDIRLGWSLWLVLTIIAEAPRSNDHMWNFFGYFIKTFMRTLSLIYSTSNKFLYAMIKDRKLSDYYMFQQVYYTCFLLIGAKI